MGVYGSFCWITLVFCGISILVGLNYPKESAIFKYKAPIPYQWGKIVKKLPRKKPKKPDFPTNSTCAEKEELLLNHYHLEDIFNKTEYSAK